MACKTVREWLEFLGDDISQKFAMECKGGIHAKPSYYKNKEDFVKEYDDFWLDQPVIQFYHNNFLNHHLMIIPKL